MYAEYFLVSGEQGVDPILEGLENGVEVCRFRIMNVGWRSGVMDSCLTMAKVPSTIVALVGGSSGVIDTFFMMAKSRTMTGASVELVVAVI